MIIIPSYVKVVSKMFGMTECYNKTTAKVQTEQKKPQKNNYYIHVDIQGSSLKQYDPKQTFTSLRSTRRSTSSQESNYSLQIYLAAFYLFFLPIFLHYLSLSTKEVLNLAKLCRWIHKCF